MKRSPPWEASLAAMWALVTGTAVLQARAGGWAYTYYLGAAAMTVAAVVEVVVIHRHGRWSAEHEMAVALEQDVFAGLVLLQLLGDLGQHRSPAFHLLLLGLVVITGGGRRRGRRRLRKLIGAKSRALLARLAAGTPAVAEDTAAHRSGRPSPLRRIGRATGSTEGPITPARASTTR